jgi:hypothetical protein
MTRGSLKNNVLATEIQRDRDHHHQDQEAQNEFRGWIDRAEASGRTLVMTGN